MVFMHGKQFWKAKLFWSFTALVLLSVAVYWQVLFFTFSKDDWGLLWGSLYDPSVYLSYVIHPVTPIEFFILSHVFGTNYILWQLFGIVIRACIALFSGYFIFALTKSQKAAILAAVFVATSYAGIESIHFMSAHATAISFLFMLWGLYAWVRYIQKKSPSILYSSVLLCIGFLLDPGRAIPLIFVIPFSFLLFSKRKIHRDTLKKYASFIIPIFFIGAAFFLFWYITQSRDSQFDIFLAKFIHDPSVFFKKLYLLGNYFGSIGNLLTGWIIPNVQDAQNTGTYSKLIARIAFIVCLISGFILFAAYKKKSISLKLISFFLVWIFIWYIPDWLFEPRTPMAGSHRYLLISGVGLSILLAYGISLVKRKTFLFVLAGIIIFLNVATTQRILTYQDTFRSAKAFRFIWEKVNNEVGKEKGPDIFVFTGKDPYVGMMAGLTSGIPFALTRHIAQQANLPLMINDPSVIVKYMCGVNVVQVGRTKKIIQTEKIPLTHVYAWDITSPKNIRSYTNEERKFLRKYAKEQGCFL